MGKQGPFGSFQQCGALIWILNTRALNFKDTHGKQPQLIETVIRRVPHLQGRGPASPASAAHLKSSPDPKASNFTFN